MLLRYLIKQDDKASLKIYDLAGKLINEIILNSDIDQIQINTNLSSGIYFCQIIINGAIAKYDKIIITQ